jgi:hypothetical protein
MFFTGKLKKRHLMKEARAKFFGKGGAYGSGKFVPGKFVPSHDL